MKIREQNDYTLGQYVVMLSGERITNIGLHENIKLTKLDLIQFLEWTKLHQPELIYEIMCRDKDFCYKENLLSTIDALGSLCQKSSD